MVALKGENMIKTNYYKNIKELFINNEINRKVKNYSISKSDLSTYYNVGKILLDAGNQYGESIIKEYSLRLTKELGSGYSQRNLRNMRQFYKVFEKWQTVSAKLSWSHYCEILWFDKNKFQYYVKITESNSLSIRQLREKIKNKEYERLPEDTKNKLVTEDKIEVNDFVPNPILIKNKNELDIVNEKALHYLIMEDIESFMKELGIGFCFIGSEYKIKVDNKYNYIDLLLYNIKYRCYVVVELKVTELKKEHTGQIMTYMNYIDKNIKSINENDTVGIIICKKNNKYVIEYCSDKRIISREYELI
jgi:predicted nuclease of restriction endonuclease-like (RecB) superfamily